MVFKMTTKAKKTIIPLLAITVTLATALCCCIPVFASPSVSPSCCHNSSTVDMTGEHILASHHAEGHHTCTCQKITQALPSYNSETTNLISSAHRNSQALTSILLTGEAFIGDAFLFFNLQGPPQNDVFITALLLKNPVLRI